MKILLAIDETPFSEEAITEAEDRFGAPDTTVRVASCGSEICSAGRYIVGPLEAPLEPPVHK